MDVSAARAKIERIRYGAHRIGDVSLQSRQEIRDELLTVVDSLEQLVTMIEQRVNRQW